MMSANLMAFSPAPSGGHHPPPWRAAQGGFSYDIEVELCVPTNKPLPGDLSAENAVWWIAALLRLSRYPFLIVPVIADQSFSYAATSEAEPVLRPFETQGRFLRAIEPTRRKLDLVELDWIKTKWRSGAQLLQRNPRFGEAFRAFDACTIVGRTSASVLTAWGAIEQLFSPSPGELRFRTSAYVAAYLEVPGPKRLSLFQDLLKLYSGRSKAAHTGAIPTWASFLELMRCCVMHW